MSKGQSSPKWKCDSTAALKPTSPDRRKFCIFDASLCTRRTSDHAAKALEHARKSKRCRWQATCCEQEHLTSYGRFLCVRFRFCALCFCSPFPVSDKMGGPLRDIVPTAADRISRCSQLRACRSPLFPRTLSGPPTPLADWLPAPRTQRSPRSPAMPTQFTQCRFGIPGGRRH